MIDAYPLQWPAHWPRSKTRTRHGSMSRKFAANRDAVLKQIALLGGRDVVISSNLSLRRDNLPYAGQAQPDDRGVAVYFTLNGESQCIPCDKWDNVEQNLRAVAMTVEALRGIERWGAKEMVNAAFRGFKALPAATIVTPYQSRLWHEVLEVSPDASPETIKAAYKAHLMKAHPDKGGTAERFQEIQKAFKEAYGR